MSKPTQRLLTSALWTTFQADLAAYRQRQASLTRLRARIARVELALARTHDRLEERFGIRLEGETIRPAVPPPAPTGTRSSGGALSPRESPRRRRAYLDRKVQEANGFYVQVLRAVARLSSATDSVVLPRAIRTHLQASGEYPATRDTHLLHRTLSTLATLRYLRRRFVLGTRRAEYHLAARGRRLLRKIGVR